ncbi:MAG: S8 family serine peptidase [Acidimicrobiia bacterium]|nr:S8 family serine peptidase [Acidimicrobiia bacterium]
MRWRRVGIAMLATWCAWLVVAGAVVGGPALAARPDSPAVGARERTLVVFSRATPLLLRDVSLRVAGIPASRVVRRVPEIATVIIEADRREVRALAANPAVIWTGRDEVVSLQAVPDDPLFPDMQNLTDIGAAAAWDAYPGAGGFEAGGPYDGAPIAVLDSGIDPDHVEFQPFASKVPICKSYPPNPLYDPVNCFNHATDDISHGTHVAGTAAAVADNSAGIAGISPTSPIYVYKTCQGRFCWVGDLVSGLVDAANDGAEVVNMSLGGPVPLPPWRDAVNYAAAHDVVVVAAAGNSGKAQYSYPASFPSVLSVAALETGTGDRAWFSQFNDAVDIAAPGTGVLGPVAPPAAEGAPDAVAAYSGTSMATPHVAGVAALVRSAHPDWSAGRVRAALLNTAMDVATPGRDRETGMGRVDAAAALAYEPADDGDLDDDGFVDDWDAAPEDPLVWQVQALSGRASVGGATVSAGWFDFLGLAGVGSLRFDLGQDRLIAVMAMRAPGTSMSGATLSGRGFRVGPGGLRQVTWRALLVDTPAGDRIRLEVGGVVVADGIDPAGHLVVRAG